MRLFATFGLIACLGVAAQAADVDLPALPQPEDNAVENRIFDRPTNQGESAFAAPSTSLDIAMPALPPDVADNIQVDAATPADNAAAQVKAAAVTGTALPDMALPPAPELPDAGATILARRFPEIVVDTTAAIPPATTDQAIAATELPPPGDPNALIAMLPPPASAPAAAAVPAPAPEGSAPSLTRLDGEALSRAFATLGKLQGFPPALTEAARVAFEEKAANAPFWTEQGRLKADATAILGIVDSARSHGLSPARFTKVRAALDEATDIETREAAVTLLALAYARDARGARVSPLQVSRLITATTTLPEPAEVLARLVQPGDAGAALEAFNPVHPGYRALRAKLTGFASPPAAAPEPAKLTFGPVLTLGMSDPRVPLLRERLGVPAADDTRYDAALVEAVRAFQREQRLKATGRLTRATVAALGGVTETETMSRDPKADIIANMERWRWLPTELGRDHVFVNIADFRLTLVRKEAAAWTTRVIVGKPETQTPVFSHKIQFAVVNPSWNVPPSIALKEYLPLLQKNPQALSARGLQVVSRGRVVDPSSVDWSKVGRTVAIRQPPGERNALGFIKFMFPNQHAVYLHDTPNRSLFANDRRAYSHGCVRVQDPFRLAEAVMGEEWTESRLRGMIGRGERQINLPADLPVHLAYFTSFVDEAGSIQTREDLYGHNRKLKALLGL